jgi:hypothetical protein
MTLESRATAIEALTRQREEYQKEIDKINFLFKWFENLAPIG